MVGRTNLVQETIVNKMIDASCNIQYMLFLTSRVSGSKSNFSPGRKNPGRKFPAKVARLVAEPCLESYNQT